MLAVVRGGGCPPGLESPARIACEIGAVGGVRAARGIANARLVGKVGVVGVFLVAVAWHGGAGRPVDDAPGWSAVGSLDGNGGNGRVVVVRVVETGRYRVGHCFGTEADGSGFAAAGRRIVAVAEWGIATVVVAAAAAGNVVVEIVAVAVGLVGFAGAAANGQTGRAVVDGVGGAVERARRKGGRDVE